MKITKQAAQIILSAMIFFFAASLAFDIRSHAGAAPIVDSIVLLLLSWAGIMASRLNLIVGSVLLFIASAVPFMLSGGDYTYAIYVYSCLYLVCASLLLISWLGVRKNRDR